MRGPHAEPERRRHHAHADVVAGQLAGVDGKLVEVEPPLLVVHDALRQSGRARRRVEQEDVVRPRPRTVLARGRRSTGAPALPWTWASFPPLGGPVSVTTWSTTTPRARRSSASLLADRPRCSSWSTSVARRSRHQVRDLAVSRPCPDADGDEAGHLRGQERDVHRGAVRQDDRDPCVLRTERHEHLGQATSAIEVLSPGQPFELGDDRRRVGLRRLEVGNDVTERRSAPGAGRHVRSDRVVVEERLHSWPGLDQNAFGSCLHRVGHRVAVERGRVLPGDLADPSSAADPPISRSITPGCPATSSRSAGSRLEQDVVDADAVAHRERRRVLDRAEPEVALQHLGRRELDAAPRAVHLVVAEHVVEAVEEAGTQPMPPSDRQILRSGKRTGIIE